MDRLSGRALIYSAVMEFITPEGWTKVTPTIYRHESGVQISLTEEFGQRGWYIIPNNDYRRERWFSGSLEGRDQAFQAFEQDSKAFQRRGSRPSDAHLPTRPCRNCGEKTAFFPDEVRRSVVGLCVDCFDYSR